MEILNERITVGVEFVPGRMIPRWFGWRGREYQVKHVPLIFNRTDGGRRYVCFSVDCGNMLAELVWDREDFNWKIAKCAPSYM